VSVELAKRDPLVTAAAVIFTVLLAWWCWPFALIAAVSWTIWLRRRSPGLAAIIALLAAAFLVADVATMGCAAAWVAKALSYNPLFKKAAAFRAVAPRYYLAHPLSVLRAWATNFKGLQYSFVRNVFLVLNALGGTLIFLVWQLYFADQAGAKKDTHGPARWAEKADLARVCEFGHGPGIVLGAMIDRKSVRIPPTLKVWMNKHVLVVGTPGSGKSRAYVRPNIMTAVREGISVLVTDPKGEIYRSMARWLRSKGYIVRKLDLVQMLESNQWNPLNEISEPLDADVFSEVVISTTDNGAQKNSDSFWNRAEQNLLKALVLYVCYEADGRRCPGTVGQVYDLVALGDRLALDSRFTILPKTHPAYGPYMISKMAGENMWGNIVIGLGTRLQTFQQEQVRRITDSTEIDLALPGKNPCAYFVITPDTHGAFNFLASLFFTFLFVRLVALADSDSTNRLPVPVRALLDEFANIVVIPEFEKKIATVRSRGIECHVIIQGLPQLERKYGRTWEEILSCCDTKLVLGVKDNHTADYVSRLIGRATVATESDSYGPGEGDHRVTRSSAGRELMMLSEVVNTRARTSLAFLPDGTPPVRLRTVDYLEFPEAEELSASGMDQPRREITPEQLDIDVDGLQNEEQVDLPEGPGMDVPPDLEEQPELPENGGRGVGEKSAWWQS